MEGQANTSRRKNTKDRSKMTFRDLIVWQKSIELAKVLYKMTRPMPDSERFGLTAQMRRAVVSIASNIAEGNARQTLKEYIYFLGIARGSIAELETQITITQELGMLANTNEITPILQEVDRLLQALIRSLKNKQNTRMPR